MSNLLNKIENEEKSIWRYANFYNEFIKPENRLYLEKEVGNRGLAPVKTGTKPLLSVDGNTYEQKNEFINEITGGKVYFKREDENETESLKGRSLAYQVSLAKQNGLKELVISTSGNAGIAAAAYCQKAGIKLYIFISPETEKEKIASMQKYGPLIIRSQKAIRLANYLAAKKKIQNLRPSRDENSIEGFKSISFEIFENIGRIDALFTFVTSGSSFIGIGKAFEYLLENGDIKKIPKLFAVQSGEIFSIAKEFEEVRDVDAVLSGAGKLGVKETGRKWEIIDLIKKSKGSSFYINSDEVNNAEKILLAQGIETSPEGCASFAGLLRWSKTNKFKKAVCILSGKKRKLAERIDERGIYMAESFQEVDEIVNKNVKIKMENDNAKI